MSSFGSGTRSQKLELFHLYLLPQVEDGNLVNLEMLTRLLEDELELEVRSGTTSRPLLRLAIQAYLLEVSSLRSLIANLESEREKLRSDVAEANQRSAIMAQEIDDQVGILKNTCTTSSLSHLRTTLLESSSWPLPAQWPNHET